MPVPDSSKHRALSKCHVLYLGSAIPTDTAQGLAAVQKPLAERYPADTSVPIQGIDAWITVLSSGVMLQYSEAVDPTIYWFPIQHLKLATAVQCVSQPLAPPQFVSLQTAGDNFAQHPLFAAIFRRTRGLKVLDCHCFLARTSKAAIALVQACTWAFQHKEGWAEEKPSDEELQQHLVISKEISDLRTDVQVMSLDDGSKKENSPGSDRQDTVSLSSHFSTASQNIFNDGHNLVSEYQIHSQDPPPRPAPAPPVVVGPVARRPVLAQRQPMRLVPQPMVHQPRMLYRAPILPPMPRPVPTVVEPVVKVVKIPYPVQVPPKTEVKVVKVPVEVPGPAPPPPPPEIKLVSDTKVRVVEVPVPYPVPVKEKSHSRRHGHRPRDVIVYNSAPEFENGYRQTRSKSRPRERYYETEPEPRILVERPHVRRHRSFSGSSTGSSPDRRGRKDKSERWYRVSTDGRHRSHSRHRMRVRSPSPDYEITQIRGGDLRKLQRTSLARNGRQEVPYRISRTDEEHNRQPAYIIKKKSKGKKSEKKKRADHSEDRSSIPEDMFLRAREPYEGSQAERKEKGIPRDWQNEGGFANERAFSQSLAAGHDVGRGENESSAYSINHFSNNPLFDQPEPGRPAHDGKGADKMSEYLP